MSVPIPAVPAILTPAEILVWVLAACVLVGAAIAAVVRFVPNGHTGVVMRFGRVMRMRQPGPAAVVPFVERVRMVPTSAAPISPLVVRATTADDVPVIVTARTVVRIDDPRQWIAAETVQPAHLVEDAIARVVGESTLSELTARPLLCDRARDTATHRLAAAGAAVDDLLVESVELQLTADLLTWANRHGEETRAPHR